MYIYIHTIIYEHKHLVGYQDLWYHMVRAQQSRLADKWEQEIWPMGYMRYGWHCIMKSFIIITTWKPSQGLYPRRKVSWTFAWSKKQWYWLMKSPALSNIYQYHTVSYILKTWILFLQIVKINMFFKEMNYIRSLAMGVSVCLKCNRIGFNYLFDACCLDLMT